jgi:hypothetical protein
VLLVLHLPRRGFSRFGSESKKPSTLSTVKRENRRLEALPSWRRKNKESASPSLSLAQQLAAVISTADFDEDEKQVFWLRSRPTCPTLPHYYAVVS